MRAKLEDVAKLAGVSPTTVSRVLNNRGYISEQTRVKVENAVKELNYYPNNIARSLFRQKTNFIGLILPTINNPFFSELAFYIEEISAEYDFKVIICNSLQEIEKEKMYVEMLIGNQVDGIVVCSYNRGIKEYNNPKLPIVAIDHYLSPTIPVVGSNNYQGGRLAVRHLIDKGCKNIIHINGPSDLETPTQQRRRAYEDLVENPITYEISDVFNEDANVNMVRKVLQEHPEVDGIFASDDLIAAACLKVADEYGINVPGDLKIVGYDGTSTVRNILPHLTTIQQPTKEIAEVAINILNSQINNADKEVDHETQLDVTLLKNDTT